MLSVFKPIFLSWSYCLAPLASTDNMMLLAHNMTAGMASAWPKLHMAKEAGRGVLKNNLCM